MRDLFSPVRQRCESVPISQTEVASSHKSPIQNLKEAWILKPKWPKAKVCYGQFSLISLDCYWEKLNILILFGCKYFHCDASANCLLGPNSEIFLSSLDNRDLDCFDIFSAFALGQEKESKDSTLGVFSLLCLLVSYFSPFLLFPFPCQMADWVLSLLQIYRVLIVFMLSVVIKM